MKFFVIGDEETVLGFRLAGIEGRVAQSPDEAREALEEAYRMENLGVIVLPERIAATVREEVDRLVYKTTFPLLIEIPDRLGPLDGRRSIKDLIREAVGVTF